MFDVFFHSSQKYNQNKPMLDDDDCILEQIEIQTNYKAIRNLQGVQYQSSFYGFLYYYREMSINFREITQKAVKSGTAGATAMTVQVLSLMWMRTTMNYQFKNGGNFTGTIRKLYAEGGVMRFYRGIVPALIIGPIARFGDTASNMFARNLFKTPHLAKAPIFIQTSLGSILAGLWRLTTLPIDAWKTSKQVHGEKGLQMLMEKYKTNGLKTFYQGGVASATATMVGHYPWFLTNNYLDFYIPKYSFKDDKLKAILRGAFIGFCCTMVSDTVSNSIRVVKTVKQTSDKHLTYKQTVNEVISKDGVSGLLFRGLKTKLLTNGVQGVIFSVAWRYFEEKLAINTKKA